MGVKKHTGGSQSLPRFMLWPRPSDKAPESRQSGQLCTHNVMDMKYNYDARVFISFIMINCTFVFPFENVLLLENPFEEHNVRTEIGVT